MLATLQSDSASGAAVSRAIRNTGSNSFQIHLTGVAAQSCEVAWFVIS